MDEPRQPVQLSDLLAALRRHANVLAVAAGIGLVLGIMAAFVIPTRYSTTATVAVYPLKTDPLSSASGTSTVDMATEGSLAESQMVAAAAATKLEPKHGFTTQDVVDAVSVETPEDSQVLRISYSASSAARAADGANEVAAAYLLTRRNEATGLANRLKKTVQGQVEELKGLKNEGALVKRTRQVQADELGTRLAELGGLEFDPGRIVGRATPPDGPSTPGVLPLGLAGAFLGLFVGVPIALTRKELPSNIGNLEGLDAPDEQLVLDGTSDADRADTWDIATFMLNIPADLPDDAPYTVLVDAEPGSGPPAPGQEFADALTRRGWGSRFVDAGGVDEGRINRGWPNDRKRKSWDGRIVVIDTSTLTSDAHRVEIASRCDAVMLTRTTDDAADSLRNLSEMLRAREIDVSLTTLFPAPEHSLLDH